MNLNQLKIFYMTAKHGSLIAAAEKLLITQPAVSKAIQRLQEHHNVKFFNRFGKKMVLTDAGASLYEIAEKIFELEKHAEESIRDFQEQKKGHIRILASESFGAYYLPSIINPFCRSHPGIRISVNILPTEHVVQNLANLNNDLGFISYRLEHKKLQIREILEDRLVIIVSPNHPLARKQSLQPQDLDGYSMIMHEKGSVPRKAINDLIRRNDISVNIPMELSSNKAIKSTVEEEIGMALISRKVAEEEIRAGKLVSISLSDLTLSRKFYMVYHQDKYISGILQRLIDRVGQWSSEYLQSLS